jgi:hypothetical protein
MLLYYCIIATIVFVAVLGIQFLSLKTKAQENKNNLALKEKEFLTLESVNAVIFSSTVAAGWPITIPLTMVTLFVRFVMNEIIEKYEVKNQEEEEKES